MRLRFKSKRWLPIDILKEIQGRAGFIHGQHVVVSGFSGTRRKRNGWDIIILLTEMTMPVIPGVEIRGHAGESLEGVYSLTKKQINLKYILKTFMRKIR